ncbi:MAG: hypothetical protein K6G64_06225 [Eubacterium sp.]|nr:hypothetical protein [Eubacterium sp.]
MYDEAKMYDVMNLVFNEKYFLLILGSIFLLGFVAKVIVVTHYRRLIRGAENLGTAENSILRQMKMRIEGVKEVSGKIVAPDALIERQLNREKIWNVSVNTVDLWIHWCATAILLWSVFGLIFNRSAINMFIGIGFALVLEAADYSFGTDRLRDEMKIILTDYIVNNSGEKKRAATPAPEKEQSKDQEKEHQERILNQVLGEYLP